MADAIVGPLLSKLQAVAVTEGKALAAVGNEIDRLLGNRDDTDLEENQQAVPIRKDEEKELHDLLLVKNESRVIYVVGESGIGKRYLAEKAYKNETIKKNFEVCMWVSFPQDTNNITDQVERKLEDECSKLQPSGKNIDQVKYLVVVDCQMSSTILEAQNWLKAGREGSKIVLTATSSPCADDIVELRCLPKDTSEKLFNRILGLRGRRMSNYKTEMMDTIRKDIEKITKGLPLAVVLLAKLMRTMDYSKWEAASKYLKENNQDDLLMTIVSMSIDDLPKEHRSCLLYTAGFPERSTIDAGQLVRLWAAEGFLIQQPGVEQEELGQRYLKEFIFRGLMQLVKKKADVVESVAIHDQVYEILRSEAQRIGLMETHYGGGYAPATVSAKRLALNNNKMPYKTKVLWKVRTVLSHGAQGIMGGAKLPSGAHDAKLIEGSQEFKEASNQLLKESSSHDAQAGPQEFKEGLRQLLKQSTFLRVISLEGINIGEKLPTRIGDMLHLQYLSVRCSSLTTVPDTIGKLKKLQTMDVRGTQVKILPMSFWKIKTLRHVLGNRDLRFHGYCQASEDVVDDGLSVHVTIKEHVDNMHISRRNLWVLVTTTLFRLLSSSNGYCWNKMLGSNEFGSPEVEWSSGLPIRIRIWPSARKPMESVDLRGHGDGDAAYVDLYGVILVLKNCDEIHVVQTVEVHKKRDHVNLSSSSEWSFQMQILSREAIIIRSQQDKVHNRQCDTSQLKLVSF
ncbi:probable disease resistance RPP8-like protein 2 [Triticum urartu]|uniref:probable disease resistance RPP8-like protein 2 n=1 Tax=Triticum urartu TaxID=4572 RepID=UPI002042F1D6|nr:probable disease resistance RPP8-like protein 2 [Triticum urartu]